jgi:CCR4-NOT transcription complex subunit 9
MSTQPSPANQTVEREKVFQWILELTNPETRENALLELRWVHEISLTFIPTSTFQ